MPRTRQPVVRLRYITEDELWRLADLEHEIDAMQSGLNASKREAKQIRDRVLHAMKTDNRERATRHGFRIYFIDAEKVSVSWKNEFIRVAGKDAAAAIVNSTPKKKRLVIEEPEE